MLYVVSTPIGNLGDMSPRAVDTLRSVDLIAAEDTRVTRRLLAHFSIHTRLVSCHEHNEDERARQLVEQMVQGRSVALVTDAGTPAVSDPGARLVAAAVQAGVPVLAVPGPSAFAAALSVSGIDNPSFTFFGFLPRERRALLDKLSAMRGTVDTAVLYESPRRVAALLKAVAEVFPGVPVSVSGELTKKFERTLRGPVERVLESMRTAEAGEKGEFCVLLDLARVPAPPAAAAPQVGLEAQLLDLQLSGMSARDAAQALTGRGEGRNQVYKAALRLKQWALDTAGEAEK